jgi:tRNA-dihydrouridine synthase B
MIGRGAYGRPWWPAVIAKHLGQDGREEPTLDEELEILLRHQQLTIELYGEHLGNKTFRKHLGWTIDRLCERGLLSVKGRATQRAALLVAKDNNAIAEGLTQLYARADALAIREAA